MIVDDSIVAQLLAELDSVWVDLDPGPVGSHAGMIDETLGRAGSGPDVQDLQNLTRSRQIAHRRNHVLVPGQSQLIAPVGRDYVESQHLAARLAKLVLCGSSISAVLVAMESAGSGTVDRQSNNINRAGFCGKDLLRSAGGYDERNDRPIAASQRVSDNDRLIEARDHLLDERFFAAVDFHTQDGTSAHREAP